MWRATRCVVHHETVIHSHGDYKSWNGRQYWCNFLSGLIMLAVSWVSIKTFIISNDEWSGGVIKPCFTMAWCFLNELHFVELINFLDSAMVCVALMYTFLKPLCVSVFFSRKKTQPSMASNASNGELQRGKKRHVMADQASLRSGQSRAGSRYQNRPFKALP